MMPKTFNADGSPDGDESSGYDYLSRSQNIKRSIENKYPSSDVSGGLTASDSYPAWKASMDKRRNAREEDSEMYAERAKRATKP